jgi:hypothetical protein
MDWSLQSTERIVGEEKAKEQNRGAKGESLRKRIIENQGNKRSKLLLRSINKPKKKS